MKLKLLCITMLIVSALTGNARTTRLKVLQMNTWIQGENIENGAEAIADVIDMTDPDIALLCEITGGCYERLLDHLCGILAERGKQYYCDTLQMSMGIISSIAPDSVSRCFTLDDKVRPNPVAKGWLTFGGHHMAIYSVHWDWTHYECYMPRGYSGTTWKKLPSPVCDADSVLAANRLSYRDEGVAALIEDASKERAKGNMVIIGGDFNEPSHLDWQADTGGIRDHNGMVIDWDCSMMLSDAGFRDCYRELYPNAVTHPGFTYPAGNPFTDISKLVWLPDRDERDRIDFIYYYPDSGISLSDVTVVGPAADILYGKIVGSSTSDPVIQLPCRWPSDHKAVFATFELK
ncbi:MAG: endonuclease/exonuclease/phosphatase family protein [Bacteroidales bacterium]|nr:endonuclease/exonuclease/phosphatase family protein [Bacteroidales bacterium]